MTAQTTRPRLDWRAYLSIARIDYWSKHIFIVPGVIVALALTHVPQPFPYLHILLGFLSACLIASANYTINEWLDSEFDRFHPTKKSRPAVEGRVTGAGVYTQYVVLVTVGLLLAATVGRSFLVISILFVASGVVYNVRPMRSKERRFLDVLTEALNNPIRLALGWTMVAPWSLPPSSLFLTYWFGGAFLMASKRIAEYRFIHTTSGAEAPGNYRESFKYYTETSLMVSAMLFSSLSAFFLATFLVKYKEEFVLSFPLFAALFAYYFALSLRPHSVAQTPEYLYRERLLMMILGGIIFAVAVLSLVDIPFVRNIVQARFTLINLGH